MMYWRGQQEAGNAEPKQEINREIAISEFKAKCLSLMEGGEQDQDSPSRDPPWQDHCGRIGSMSAGIEITGDLISPVIEAQEIETLK
jgi:hypothetical protein